MANRSNQNDPGVQNPNQPQVPREDEDTEA